MSPTSLPSLACDADPTPSHYKGATCPHCQRAISPKDLFISVDGLRANVMKYAYRAGKKPGEPAIRDLGKCLDYLLDAIARDIEIASEADAKEKAISEIFKKFSQIQERLKRLSSSP